ncbi:ABC transporter permease [Acrocarpospora catenulata]|uniref:ABC transporter permease n=1 Tax=Acrocarpospora catenulata TaxID=2836182 RepID=UPI0027E1E6E9|nr:ABC transporter permease [Acrocarpospora catenulata]
MTTDTLPAVAAVPRTRRGTLGAGFWISVALIALFLSWALFPALFTGHDPIASAPAQRLQAPGAAHPFGTDQLGRDLYARVVYGAGASIRATVVAVLVGMTAGTLIGLVSGFVGGWLDAVLMRVVDVLLAIPALLISLTIVTALGFGVVKVALAVGVAAIAGFARVMRAEVLRVRTSAFVEAALACGVRRRTIALRTVLPHAIGSVLVLAALEFGTAILAVSALSFLGFGAVPPNPEWGLLVADGRTFLASAWWLTTIPGLVIALAVTAANVISRTFKDRSEVHG